MIFSKIDIEKAIENEEIVITPLSKDSIRLASIELSLGNDILYIPKDGGSIDVSKPETCSNFKAINYSDDEAINVDPGSLTIAITKETVKLPANVMARIEGESILRSLGLIIYSREEHLEPNSSGLVSFILKNIGSRTIVIKPGMKICRLVFEQLLTPIEEIKKEVKPKAQTTSGKKQA